VPRGIDQIEHVLRSIRSRVVHADGLRLDGDSTLAFQIHLVEELGALLPRAEGARRIEQTIGQRALAVVDVSDDAEVAYVLRIGHGLGSSRFDALRSDRASMK